MWHSAFSNPMRVDRRQPGKNLIFLELLSRQLPIGSTKAAVTMREPAATSGRMAACWSGRPKRMIGSAPSTDRERCVLRLGRSRLESHEA